MKKAYIDNVNHVLEYLSHTKKDPQIDQVHQLFNIMYGTGDEPSYSPGLNRLYPKLIDGSQLQSQIESAVHDLSENLHDYEGFLKTWPVNQLILKLSHYIEMVRARFIYLTYTASLHADSYTPGKKSILNLTSNEIFEDRCEFSIDHGNNAITFDDKTYEVLEKKLVKDSSPSDIKYNIFLKVKAYNSEDAIQPSKHCEYRISPNRFLPQKEFSKVSSLEIAKDGSSVSYLGTKAKQHTYEEVSDYLYSVVLNDHKNFATTTTAQGGLSKIMQMVLNSSSKNIDYSNSFGESLAPEDLVALNFNEEFSRKIWKFYCLIKYSFTDIYEEILYNNIDHYNTTEHEALRATFFYIKNNRKKIESWMNEDINAFVESFMNNYIQQYNSQTSEGVRNDYGSKELITIEAGNLTNQSYQHINHDNIQQWYSEFKDIKDQQVFENITDHQYYLFLFDGLKEAIIYFNIFKEYENQKVTITF